MEPGDSRICLHRFEHCEAADSIAHPHPWPSSMLILSGKYDMAVLRTEDLESAEPSPVIDLTLNHYSAMTAPDLGGEVRDYNCLTDYRRRPSFTADCW